MLDNEIGFFFFFFLSLPSDQPSLGRARLDCSQDYCSTLWHMMVVRDGKWIGLQKWIARPHFHPKSARCPKFQFRCPLDPTRP
ncbi:hypothetical protein C8R46DRAFT_1068957 [Mycena filopes]|nr:hypothetical protein C8R46DRAFT_1068957 [Mycena filopes]